MRTEKELVKELCKTLRNTLDEARLENFGEMWKISGYSVKKIETLMWMLKDSEEE